MKGIIAWFCRNDGFSAPIRDYLLPGAVFLSNDAGKNEKCGRIPVVSIILVFFIIQLKY
jgi:hypothetical protein